MTQKANPKAEKRNIPNSAFDIEYRTEWREEVDFLAERGIYYTIRKREGEYQIPVYKYTKTVDLFIALADFYLRNKRNLKSQAKYKNPKYEQQSFINKDNTINEKFVVDKPAGELEEIEVPDMSVFENLEDLKDDTE